jgi:putative hydroxymethylpyrimidine transporter CytX
MEKGKTSILNNGMLWFGAAVSIAEILTGSFIAPLGFKNGIAAIVLGHIIGCTLLYLAGLIGAETGKSAMETVKISFGSKGSIIFSLLNVIQLLGWTAVMIIMGARAAGVIANPSFHLKGETLWCVIIGALIILWILVGLENLSKINGFAVAALFVLTIVLCVVIFKGHSASRVSGSITFGAAIELAAAMPISWLPLISDYTKEAKQPKFANAVSVIVYFFTSCWMYIIGLGAAIMTGKSDIAQVMLNAGLGIMGIIIILSILAEGGRKLCLKRS